MSRAAQQHPSGDARGAAVDLGEVVNFGGNLRFAPRERLTPASEAEVLEILRRHRGEKIRVAGRLHSWSPLVPVEGVLLDLRKLNSVAVHADGNQFWAEVGAGCQIKRLLSELRKQGFTTLSQGLIKEQAIAGAAATGTHGSGRSSFSHYIQAVRVARFDSVTGEPVIEQIDAGLALQAARCHLGGLGVVTSVRIPIRRAYFVEEHFRRYGALPEVLAAEAEYDLQQFYYNPWRWDFFAQHRREASGPRSRLALLYRLYWAVGMDRLMHWIMIALARWLPGWCTRLFFGRVLPGLVPQGWKVVDRSDLQLSMGHELYRHIETELFVTREHLADALHFVQQTLRHAAGEAVVLPDEQQQRLRASGLWSQWETLRAPYVHHYPICIRKVLPDDTLLSMASGVEPRYAISLVCYAAPQRRDGFFRTMELLAGAMADLFQARPHWGKHCPLDAARLQTLYPRWDEFRQILLERDPQHAFANDWLTELFQLRQRTDQPQP